MAFRKIGRGEQRIFPSIQPYCRVAISACDVQNFCETQVRRGFATLRGAGIPVHRVRQILSDALAALIQVSKIVLRPGVSDIRVRAIELNRMCFVRRGTVRTPDRFIMALTNGFRCYRRKFIKAITEDLIEIKKSVSHTVERSNADPVESHPFGFNTQAWAVAVIGPIYLAKAMFSVEPVKEIRQVSSIESREPVPAAVKAHGPADFVLFDVQVAVRINEIDEQREAVGGSLNVAIVFTEMKLALIAHLSQIFGDDTRSERAYGIRVHWVDTLVVKLAVGSVIRKRSVKAGDGT